MSQATTDDKQILHEDVPWHERVSTGLFRLVLYGVLSWNFGRDLLSGKAQGAERWLAGLTCAFLLFCAISSAVFAARKWQQRRRAKPTQGAA